MCYLLIPGLDFDGGKSKKALIHEGSANALMSMKMMKDESYDTLLRHFMLVFHTLKHQHLRINYSPNEC